MKENRKFISRVFLLIQTFLLTACFYSVNGCNSGDTKSNVKPGLEADYLVLNEKILLNFFGSSEDKKWSIKTLENRCEDSEDPHACYNLATHLYSLKDYSGAMKYAEKAVLLEPKDSLYMEMYRRAVIENGKLEKVNPLTLPKNQTPYLVTKLESDCQNKNLDSAFETAKELVSRNVLSTESIQNGFLPECLSEKMIAELKSKSKRNTINFSNYYYTEKNKSNIFFSIWDTSYLTQNKPIEKEESLKFKVTQEWRDFRKAISSKNEKLARKKFGDFLKELKELKSDSKHDSNLITAIERAAKLLIEQDTFFARYKSLADEL